MIENRNANFPYMNGREKNEKIVAIQHLLESSWQCVSKNNTNIIQYAEDAEIIAKSIRNPNYIGLAQLEIGLYFCIVKNIFFESIQLSNDAFKLLTGAFKKVYTLLQLKFRKELSFLRG